MLRGLILCLVLGLCACASSSEQLRRDASEYSAIAVAHADFKPQRTQTFAWYSDIIWSSEVVARDQAMSDRMRELIAGELTRKGYYMIADQQQADYIIGAAIVDGSSQRSEQLRRFFRLFPVIGESRGHFPETTALIGVIHRDRLSAVQADNGLREVLWRASLKAYVLGDKLSPEQQDRRLAAFAAQLMRRFPVP